MSATIKRKHLVLTGLVIALGTAMFVNWYYTKPEAKSVSKAADETTTVSANLGDAMYVNGTAAAAESDWLSEAKLKRTSARGCSRRQATPSGLPWRRQRSVRRSQIGA